MLTQKQQEIKDLLDADKSIEEIAGSLNVTKSAIYGHIRKMKEDGVALPDSVGKVGSRKGSGGRKRATTGNGLRAAGAPNAEKLAQEFKDRIALERQAIVDRREAIKLELEDLDRQDEQLVAVEDRLRMAPLAGAVKTPAKRGPGRPRKTPAPDGGTVS